MQKRTDWYITGRTWLAIDGFIAWFSVIIAYLFNEDLSVSWTSNIPGQPSAYAAALGFAICISICTNVVGLHDPLRQQRFWPTLGRILLGVGSGIGCYLLFLYLSYLFVLGRVVLVQLFALSIFLMLGLRVIIWRVSKVNRRRVFLMIPEFDRLELANMIDKSGLPFEIVGLYDKNAYEAKSDEELIQVCRSLKIDEIVIDHRIFQKNQTPWIACLANGVQVSSINSFLERYFYKVSCNRVGISWLLELDLRLTHPIYHRWKRLFDIAIALVGLTLTFPLMVTIAILILVESGRPIFYRQKRVGLREQPFTIWKFRTMVVHSEEENSRWASKNDNRVTLIGKLLRRTRFDEIPQFWNILMGEMSMIGPRPEWTDIAEIWGKKVPLYPYRHLVKPGLTGWAQINYPYAATEEDVIEKLSYDFYYMKHASALLDLQIILRTIAAIMKGAR
jgi:exopolysaccharide biosynthesis polyprenyl glycosylphosphotransferase